jgi:hypothetical protein
MFAFASNRIFWRNHHRYNPKLLKRYSMGCSCGQTAERKVKTASGPEQPTMAERIIGLTRLPYTVGCLLIAVATGPSYFLVFYLGSLNMEDALRGVVSSNAFRVTQFGQEIPLDLGLMETTLFTLALFLTLYLVRHWRLKLMSAQSSLSSLSPDGETAYHRAFGLVSSSKGALLVAFVIFLVYFPPRCSPRLILFPF